ncbi:MAG: CRISPR system precrRNA processing endoribonuclease RAMP protein Cas6 [Trebonia sp.]
MPVIVELRLRADRVTRAPYVPTTIQVHGLACTLFEGAAPGSHEAQHKAFSIWPLTPVADGWLLRAAWLASGFPQQALAACGQLRVGPVFCTVTDLALRPESFAALASGPPGDGVRLEFRSPAYFSQSGSRVVTPDPRLIVGSWHRRWNAYADENLAIPDEDCHAIGRGLRLTEFDLRTQPRDTGYGRDRQGFTGTATLRLDKTISPQARAQFSALARFAGYCGTGAQTTHAFGATAATLIPARLPAPDEPSGAATTAPAASA